MFETVSTRLEMEKCSKSQQHQRVNQREFQTMATRTLYSHLLCCNTIGKDFDTTRVSFNLTMAALKDTLPSMARHSSASSAPRRTCSSKNQELRRTCSSKNQELRRSCSLENQELCRVWRTTPTWGGCRRRSGEKGRGWRGCKERWRGKSKSQRGGKGRNESLSLPTSMSTSTSSTTSTTKATWQQSKEESARQTTRRNKSSPSPPSVEVLHLQ